MAGVHPVFHVSMLRKYIKDPELKIEADPIIIQQDLAIDAQPVRILEFSERVMPIVLSSTQGSYGVIKRSEKLHGNWS
jgi:hypothetical protein